MSSFVAFFGLLTFDHLLTVERLPSSNEKITAIAESFSFGGPASNAAATASVLGSSCRLITGVGTGPFGRVAAAQLRALNVDLHDVSASDWGDIPVSTILSTQSTGERAVVSLNASGRKGTARAPVEQIRGASCLLVDGHHMGTAIELARAANEFGVPVIFDGGSWKSGTEDLLKFVDVAVVSADFNPPDQSNALDYLEATGCKAAVQTSGADPIQARVGDDRFQIDVRTVEVVDTLGAGDVFHGAFAHFFDGRLDRDRLSTSLEAASHTASESCRHAGAHGWMTAR